MPVPLVCLDARVRQWAATFAACFSKPQYQHFVTVLLGLLLCQEGRTLTGLLRQVEGGPSVASLSRFLARAPWDDTAVARAWRARFETQLTPAVQGARARQRQARSRRVGRPKAPLVTGYLSGDDSTLAKPKGKKMEGVGRHYSSAAAAPVRGHSLGQGLYVLCGRRCPLTPRLYQQERVCAARGRPFRSKIDLMEEHIRTFEPLTGTRTHVLLDSWSAEQGWRWQQLSTYAAGLTADDFTLLDWPRQGDIDDPDEPRHVYVHVVQTRVRKLYRCPLVIARPSLDAPASATRFWASSDLDADMATLLGHIAARWDVENAQPHYPYTMHHSQTSDRAA